MHRTEVSLQITRRDLRDSIPVTFAGTRGMLPAIVRDRIAKREYETRPTFIEFTVGTVHQPATGRLSRLNAASNACTLITDDENRRICTSIATALKFVITQPRHLAAVRGHRIDCRETIRGPFVFDGRNFVACLSQIIVSISFIFGSSLPLRETISSRT